MDQRQPGPELRVLKYIAKIAPVREVSLVGTADLAFWTGRLSRANLIAADHDGRAQVVLSATDSTYKGIPFRELTVVVCAYDPQGGEEREGFFLPHAFNSSRVFAWCERRCFSTPYFHGTINVEVGPPASFQVAQGGRTLVHASMAPGVAGSARLPSHSGDSHWAGPIFLPRHERRVNDSLKVFYAKLSGHTQAYAFDPSIDTVAIEPSTSTPALAWLLDSGFSGREWLLRAAGRHARSKTFRRLNVKHGCRAPLR